MAPNRPTARAKETTSATRPKPLQRCKYDGFIRDFSFFKVLRACQGKCSEHRKSHVDRTGGRLETTQSNPSNFIAQSCSVSTRRATFLVQFRANSGRSVLLTVPESCWDVSRVFAASGCCRTFLHWSD